MQYFLKMRLYGCPIFLKCGIIKGIGCSVWKVLFNMDLVLLCLLWNIWVWGMKITYEGYIFLCNIFISKQKICLRNKIIPFQSLYRSFFVWLDNLIFTLQYFQSILVFVGEKGSRAPGWNPVKKWFKILPDTVNWAGIKHTSQAMSALPLVYSIYLLYRKPHYY